MHLRSRNGQSLTELFAGLMVVIPVVLFCVDVGTLFLGVSVNSTACRDAARAASTGKPGVMSSGTRDLSSGTQPYDRAIAVLKKGFKTSGAVQLSDDIKVTETLRSPVPTAPFGGPVDGEVTVLSKITVAPPFLISAVVGPGGVQFQTSQTFPYTYQLPGTAAGESGDQPRGVPTGGNGPNGPTQPGGVGGMGSGGNAPDGGMMPRPTVPGGSGDGNNIQL